MFERFTDRARRVVVLAQEGSRDLKHDHISPLHLLYGLAEEGEGIAAVALKNYGIRADLVQNALKVSPETGFKGGHLPFTPEAKKVLEFSLREALQLGHNYIGTEHLLLGLLRTENATIKRFLEAFDVDANKVRMEAIRLLGGYHYKDTPDMVSFSMLREDAQKLKERVGSFIDLFGPLDPNHPYAILLSILGDI